MSESPELMKLYVPLRVNRDEGVVWYQDASQPRFRTRPDAIVAAVDLVATFQRLERRVEVYVQDHDGGWHLVSGRGRVIAEDDDDDALPPSTLDVLS